MIQYKNQHVTIFQSALYQTTSTVIQTPDLVLLIDPTWLPGEVAEIRSYVIEVLAGRPLYLLFTHSDWDHVIAWKAFPEATTVGSRTLADHPQKEAVLDQIRNFDAKNYIERSYEIAYPELDHIIEADGQQLRVGETMLTFYLAPGHTPCGLFTLIDSLGVFSAGDYLSDVEFPFVYHGSIYYEETMRKARSILQNHPVQLLIPGHGQATTEREEMERRVDESLDYIRTLRQAIAEDDQERIDSMIAPYAFARMLKGSHNDNIEQFKRERSADA